MRKIKPSPEQIKLLGKKKSLEFWGWFPLCPWRHPSWGERVKHVNEQYAKYKGEQKIKDAMPDVCNLKGKKQYEIYCNECGELMGTVWATDKTLTDWCSFRYRLKLTKDEWRGCRTPNVSPLTGKLSMECCCGTDTRDFTLTNSKQEKITKIGRDYNKKDSKYKIREVE